jgi:hypothetical protein
MIWDAVSGGVSERVGDAKDAVGASAGGPIIGVRGCSPGCLAFETYTADLHLSHPNGTYDSSLPTHWPLVAASNSDSALCASSLKPPPVFAAWILILTTVSKPCGSAESKYSSASLSARCGSELLARTALARSHASCRRRWTGAHGLALFDHPPRPPESRYALPI